MDLLQDDKEIMNCQIAWSLPSLLHSLMIKYNHDAMKLIDESPSGETALYGISDWDIARKGRRGKIAYVHIRVCCAERSEGSHEYGQSVSLKVGNMTRKVISGMEGEPVALSMRYNKGNQLTGMGFIDVCTGGD